MQGDGVAADLIQSRTSAIFLVSPTAADSMGLPLPMGRTFKVTGSDWDQVVRAHAILEGTGADEVIAIGGGKVLDVAKLAVRLARIDAELPELLVKRQVPADALHDRRRLTAIPTTTGSGSEANAVAILGIGGAKVPVTASTLIPDEAVYDPLLPMSATTRVRAASAWDAITHVIESYASPLATPVTRQWAVAGGRGAVAYLTQLVDGGTADEAAMQWAGLWASLAQSVTSVGLVHAISHALEWRTGLLHGELNACFLARVIQHNAEKKHELYQRLACELGWTSVESLLDCLNRLLAASPLAPLPTIEPSQEICQRIARDICARTNPRLVSADHVRAILAGGSSASDVG